MFTIYNNGSVQFRSTSDNLYNLEKVDKPAQSRHKPDDDMYHYLDNESKNNKQQYSEKAIESYKKIANIDTSEVVYHIQDIMSTNCITINSNKTLNDAYELLKEKQVSQIPVVSDDNRIVSIIGKKNILNLLMEDFKNGEITLNKKLKNIGFPKFITTDPISDIRRVAKVMIEQKTDAIPVVNQNGFLTGIVSKTDIIKAVSRIPDLKLWA